MDPSQGYISEIWEQIVNQKQCNPNFHHKNGGKELKQNNISPWYKRTRLNNIWELGKLYLFTPENLFMSNDNPVTLCEIKIQ